MQGFLQRSEPQTLANDRVEVRRQSGMSRALQFPASSVRSSSSSTAPLRCSGKTASICRRLPAAPPAVPSGQLLPARAPPRPPLSMLDGGGRGLTCTERVTRSCAGQALDRPRPPTPPGPGPADRPAPSPQRVLMRPGWCSGAGLARAPAQHRPAQSLRPASARRLAAAPSRDGKSAPRREAGRAAG